MTTIIVTCVIFLQLLQYLIFLDVILSWLSLAGVRFRPRFVREILDPIYNFVRTYIPTTFGPLDLTPIIVLFATLFCMQILLSLSPEAYTTLSRLL